VKSLHLCSNAGWYQIRQAFVKQAGIGKYNANKLDGYYSIDIFKNFEKSYKILQEAVQDGVYLFGFLPS
jgi:hypothetical protein